MRKPISIFFLSVVLFSCTTDNELVYQEHSNIVPELNKRSLTEALDIAQEAASLFNAKSRGAESRTIDMTNIQYLCSNSNSRSQSNDTLLYVINYADDNGFAVVSANPNTTGLVAVTEKGTYSPTSEEINNNIGMGLFMDMAGMYVSSAGKELQDPNSPSIKEVIETVDTTDTWIAPKLTTKWGQTYYEGAYCPNGKSGCSNTAMAQIMTYFEYPTQLNLTYEDAPVSVVNLDWSEIKKYEGHFYSDTANVAACKAVGYLCRQLGELAHSNYNSNGTATYTVDALNAMSSLGYTVSSSVQNYANTNFLSVLRNNNLIYMRGEQVSENNNVAHAWVVDGLFEREIHYMGYTREVNSPLMEFLYENYIYHRYNHINWGLDGSCNGYFLEDVFNMSNGSQYDNSYDNYYNINFSLYLQYFLITK